MATAPQRGPNTVGDSWKRIAKWYRNHASKDACELAGPATKKEIELVEAILEVRLPANVQQSYRVHNGSRHTWVFGYWGYYLCLPDLVQSWALMLHLAKNPQYRDLKTIPLGPIKPDVWNPRWVPLCGNGSGDHVCSDLDPPSGGRLGQVISFSHEEGPRNVLAGSFLEWLAEFAQELESGKFVYDEQRCMIWRT